MRRMTGRTWGAAGYIALVLLAACGNGRERNGTATSTPAATTPEATSMPEATTPVSAGTNAPADASTTPPTTVASADGSYASAIAMTEVDNPALDAFEADVMARVDAVGLPGAGLLVVQHGELVQFEGWGEYDLDTAVPIASGSKWLSGVTIMTLVDDGLIDLDQPISEYVPGADRAPGTTGQITMRMLLAFTSGLLASERFPCMDDPTSTLQACAREIVARGVVHPPGTGFRYGSQHLQVAAAIAEIVSGKSFVELFNERVAGPLGMTTTAFSQTGSGGQFTDVTNPVPAGSAVSSMADYARFLEMLVHGGVAPDGTRIISEAALAEMDLNHTDTVDYITASSFRVNTRGVYGLAHWIDWTYPDGSWMVMSSDGARGFRPWIDRENDLFGVYLINDQGEGYVEGDPDAPVDDAGKVHTSGMWVFSDVAAALGGALPEDFYLHRS